MKQVMVNKLAAFVLLPGVVFLDRITKVWALHNCRRPVAIFPPYASCKLTFNRGVSWSLLSFDDDSLFFLLTIGIMGIIMMLLGYTRQRHKTGKSIVGELLVIAGALGNLFDRFLFGGVIDFIVLQYHTYVWPVFNVADVAVVCGIGLMVLGVYIDE